MSQPITPALREWIIAQAQQGFAADVVLKSMMDSGWKEDVAIAALETTLQNHLANQTTAPVLPPAVTVPRPSVDDSPLYIDAGDRRVSVLSSLAKPHIVVFGNVLSDDECDALIAAAKPRLNRSLTVETKTGGEELNADRTSNGMFFRRDENEVVATLEKRLAALANWPIENGEGLQVLHYRPGTEYKPHYDYFDPVEPGTPTILKRGGQRVATIIMYLSEPEKGGGTTFPDVQLEVAPKRGNAVFFSYDRPHPSSKSLHGGAPVIAGEKWIATKWLRERQFV
ncbi:MAG: 2OG-Fe(II) oxygenase [Burkholderiaceae bacterium]